MLQAMKDGLEKFGSIIVGIIDIHNRNFLCVILYLG